MRTLAALVLGVLATVAGAGACTPKAPFYDYAAEPDPRLRPFVLGPSDVLRVNVWKNVDLSGDVMVRPDGTIVLPLIGEVRAAGRTATDVRSEIAKRLEAFVKEDANNVTVSVSAINSYRFVVNGNVERIGAYTSNHYVTVSEAIALAGGPNRFADPDRTIIIREDVKGKKRIPIDYPAILKGTHPEQDLPLVAGDVVWIP